MVVPGQHDGQGLEGGPQRCDAGALTGAGGEERGRDGVRRGRNGRRRGRGVYKAWRFGASPLSLRYNYSQHTKRGGASKRRIRTRELAEEREEKLRERERRGSRAVVVELDRPVRIGGGESSRPRTSLDSVPATALLILLASDFSFWGFLGGGCDRFGRVEMGDFPAVWG